LGLIKQSEQDDGVIDLNEASKTLDVQKRRIYDITNVLEGIGLIEKRSKNRIHWLGSGISSPEDRPKIDYLKQEIEILKEEESELDGNLRGRQLELKELVDNPSSSKFAFVTHDDIRNLPSMTGQTLIAIKAPTGTRLEVPDPDEGISGKRRYQIFLRSENGTPIDVYLVSQEPELQQPLDEINPDIGITSLQPQSTPVKKISSISPETNIDSSGLLKLGSPIQVDTDYYLNNMYQTEGISDFYSDYDNDATSSSINGEELLGQGRVS